MINKIILGTVQLGLKYGINNVSGKPSTEEAFSILNKAYVSGIDSLDTAKDYGDSQKVIGEFLQENPGKKFKILSKFKASAQTTFEVQMDQILNEIGVRSLECFSYHQFKDVQDQDLQKKIIGLKHDGMVSKIGVSVYGNDEFEKAIKLGEIDVIQLPFNLLDNWSQRGSLITEAKKNKKEIHIRSAFLQGLFFKDLNHFPPKLSPLASEVEKLRILASRFGISIGEMALAYPLSIPEIDKVLIGVESVSQLEGIIQMTKTPITPELRREIDQFKVKDASLLDPRNWT